MRVLVTGFGAFLDHHENPSATIARALAGRRVGGVVLTAHAPLPVAYGAAFADALAAARRARASAIVAIGLAAQTCYVRVERRAINACTSASPDARGEVRCGYRIVPGGPRSLTTSFDAPRAASAMRATGLDARLSDDAGGYVCNDLYYRLLHARVPALFVHVPKDVRADRAAAALASAIGQVVASAPWTRPSSRG